MAEASLDRPVSRIFTDAVEVRYINKVRGGRVKIILTSYELQYEVPPWN